MKRSYLIAMLLATVLGRLNAQNPIIQTSFTADPAPMVYNDTVFLYTSHDEDDTKDNFFTMYDWHCYSSVDMVNWTNHGAVASLKNFKWLDKTNGAWAVQCIERNGKFFLYVPIHGTGICVLVADSPYGPFTDPLGKQLIDSDHLWNDIDPTVYIDDDGQAYLYWGNPNVWYVKLNEDMLSYDQSIGNNGVVSVDMVAESFGKGVKKDGTPGTKYVEGPWFYKRNNLYYLIYAAEGVPEYIGYSTSKSPEGPWVYQGIIMERSEGLAFTNHAGIIDYKGNSYFFYHNQGLPNGGGFRRSTCVEQFEYNSDGTLPLITPTKEGVKEGVAYLNPFKRNEAETMAWSEGVKYKEDNEVGVFITAETNNAFTKIKGVDFGEKGAVKFTAQLGISNDSGAIMEVRLDSREGLLVGSVQVPMSGGDGKWGLVAIDVEKISGVHDVYFIFKGKTEKVLMNFDYWQFME